MHVVYTMGYHYKVSFQSLSSIVLYQALQIVRVNRLISLYIYYERHYFTVRGHQIYLAHYRYSNCAGIYPQYIHLSH